MKNFICNKNRCKSRRRAGAVWTFAALALAFFAGGSSGYSGNNSAGADFQRMSQLLREAESGPARNIQNDIRELKSLLPRLQSEVQQLRQQVQAKERELQQAEQQLARQQAQQGGNSFGQKAKGFFKKLAPGEPPQGFSSWQEYHNSLQQDSGR